MYILMFQNVHVACKTLLKSDILNPLSIHDATSKIDDVLTEHGGLLHFLPYAFHLIFFSQISRGTIVRHSYSLSIVVEPLLHG